MIFIFGYTLSLFQPINNFIDCLTIQSTRFPNLFLYLTIFFHQTAIHTKHYRHGIVRILHLCIESFSFLLSDTIIIVGSRSQHQILAISLIHTLGHNLCIENNREYLFAQRIKCFTFRQRKFGSIDTFQSRLEKFRSETRHELISSIMMVNAIREPYTLQISFKVLKIRIRTVTLIIGIHHFQHLTDDKIVFTILVKKNITSLQSCFRQVIHQFLLFQRKFFKTVYLKTQQLQISKLFYGIVELIFHLFFFLITSNQCHCSHKSYH